MDSPLYGPAMPEELMYVYEDGPDYFQIAVGVIMIGLLLGIMFSAGVWYGDSHTFTYISPISCK